MPWHVVWTVTTYPPYEGIYGEAFVDSDILQGPQQLYIDFLFPDSVFETVVVGTSMGLGMEGRQDCSGGVGVVR